MKTNLHFCLLLFFGLTATHLSAQDLVFSQYRNTPLALNPALVSAGNDALIAIDYREQRYNSSMNVNTVMLNAMHPFNRKKSGTRWGGLGLGIYQDESQNTLRNLHQGGAIAFAFNFNLKPNQFLSFGAQGGMFQRKISLDGVTTGSQWIPNVGYDPAAASGENLPNDRITYYTLSTGLLWYVTDDNGNVKGSLGASAYNLNQPDVSFFKSGYQLPQRFTAHGSYVAYDNQRTSLTAEALMSTSASVNNTQLGVRLGYSFEQFNPFNPFKSGSVDVGLRYALENKTVISVLQFNQPAYSIGFSYDLNLQSTPESRSFSQAFEFVFVLKKILPVKKQVAAEPKTVENYSLGQIREFYQQQEPAPVAVDSTKSEEAQKSVTEDPQFRITKDFKYDFNKTDLNEDARAYLDGIYSLLYFNSDLKLEVVGHTDSVGSVSANKKISYRRAKTVADYLASKGIDKKRLKARGEGASKPIAGNETEEERAKNRRVEFNLYKE